MKTVDKLYVGDIVLYYSNLASGVSFSYLIINIDDTLGYRTYTIKPIWDGINSSDYQFTTDGTSYKLITDMFRKYTLLDKIKQWVSC